MSDNDMSSYDSDTPLSQFSPRRASVASVLTQIRDPNPSVLVTVQGLVDFQSTLYDLEKEIADGKAADEKNSEQQDFMALPPAGDVGDDNVFSVGAESQFLDSTPQAPGEHVLNLRQQLDTLCSLRNSLSSKILENGDKFFQWLSGHFHDMKIYGNHPLVAGPAGQSMLVPMLSFYGIATKDMIPNIKLKTRIESITKNIKARVKELFTTPLEIYENRVDCPEPSGTNLVWNVRLTLNGNIFTLLTFRVVAMTNINFSPQVSPLSPENLFMLLCFALLSKACAKDFNCLCGMPDIDVQLFKSLASDPKHLEDFALFVKKFLAALADPQLDSKRSYMITALHNLVASSNDDTTKTGETLAYKKLFDGDVSGSGLNTFNPIMNQISQVIKILRLPKLSEFGLELQVSLCGGRMIYKLGDVLRSYITQPVESNPVVIAALGDAAIYLLTEMKKPLNLPSDSDYTLTFAGLSHLEPEFVQTILMFITLCTQLGIKRIVDDFCTSQNPDAASFLRELAVIGMSLVGGDFQLSSARNSCDALSFLDEINVKDGVDGVDGVDEGREEEYDADATSPIVANRVGKIKIGDVVGSFFSSNGRIGLIVSSTGSFVGSIGCVGLMVGSTGSFVGSTGPVDLMVDSIGSFVGSTGRVGLMVGSTGSFVGSIGCVGLMVGSTGSFVGSIGRVGVSVIVGSIGRVGLMVGSINLIGSFVGSIGRVGLIVDSMGSFVGSTGRVGSFVGSNDTVGSTGSPVGSTGSPVGIKCSFLGSTGCVGVIVGSGFLVGNGSSSGLFAGSTGLTGSFASST